MVYLLFEVEEGRHNKLWGDKKKTLLNAVYGLHNGASPLNKVLKRQ